MRVILLFALVLVQITKAEKATSRGWRRRRQQKLSPTNVFLREDSTVSPQQGRKKGGETANKKKQKGDKRDKNHNEKGDKQNKGEWDDNAPSLTPSESPTCRECDDESIQDNAESDNEGVGVGMVYLFDPQPTPRGPELLIMGVEDNLESGSYRALQSSARTGRNTMYCYSMALVLLLLLV